MSRKIEANRAVIEDVAILARKAYPQDAELQTRRQAARHRIGTTGQIFWTAVATSVQELIHTEQENQIEEAAMRFAGSGENYPGRVIEVPSRPKGETLP